MPGSENPTGNEAAIEHLTRIQAQYEAELLSKPHVIGVAVGIKQQNGEATGDLSLVVMVDEKIPVTQLSDEERIPAEIEGFPVDVQQTGFFYAQ